MFRLFRCHITCLQTSIMPRSHPFLDQFYATRTASSPTDFDIFLLNKILELPLSPLVNDGEQADMEHEQATLPIGPVVAVQIRPPSAVIPFHQLEVLVGDKRFPIALLKCPVKVMGFFIDVYHMQPWAAIELNDARRRKKNRFHQRVTRARHGKGSSVIAEESDDEGACDTFDMPDAFNKLEISMGARAFIEAGTDKGTSSENSKHFQ